MEEFTGLFILMGGSIVAIALIVGIGYLIIRHRRKKKMTTSLPNGADMSDFTEDFIRQYDNPQK